MGNAIFWSNWHSLFDFCICFPSLTLCSGSLSCYLLAIILSANVTFRAAFLSWKLWSHFPLLPPSLPASVGWNNPQFLLQVFSCKKISLRSAVETALDCREKGELATPHHSGAELGAPGMNQRRRAEEVETAQFAPPSGVS